MLDGKETVKKEIAPVSKKIRFTAGLRYNESRDLVRTVHPGLPEYVGTPTLELDAAWEDLIGGSSTLQDFDQSLIRRVSGQRICDCQRAAWTGRKSIP